MLHRLPSPSALPLPDLQSRCSAGTRLRGADDGGEGVHKSGSVLGQPQTASEGRGGHQTGAHCAQSCTSRRAAAAPQRCSHAGPSPCTRRPLPIALLTLGDDELLHEGRQLLHAFQPNPVLGAQLELLRARANHTQAAKSARAPAGSAAQCRNASWSSDHGSPPPAHHRRRLQRRGRGAAERLGVRRTSIRSLSAAASLPMLSRLLCGRFKTFSWCSCGGGGEVLRGPSARVPPVPAALHSGGVPFRKGQCPTETPAARPQPLPPRGVASYRRSGIQQALVVLRRLLHLGATASRCAARSKHGGAKNRAPTPRALPLELAPT